jgi:hypothetical protein
MALAENMELDEYVEEMEEEQGMIIRCRGWWPWKLICLWFHSCNT